MSPSSGASTPRLVDKPPDVCHCTTGVRSWPKAARGRPSRSVDDCHKGKLADVSSKALKDKGLDSRGVGGVTKKVLSLGEIIDLVESCAEIPDHIKASIRSLLESAR